MKLYGSYPSHFTRKVRILLQELGLKHEFIVLKNLTGIGSENFANNPLHLYPVLEDGANQLIDSNVICEYLIDAYGKSSSFKSYFPSIENKLADQKRLAIMNGAMSAGALIMQARRSEILDYGKYPLFLQQQAAVEESLDWLNQDLAGREGYYSGQFTILDITLQCLCEWVIFRAVVPSLEKHGSLARFVEIHKSRPSVATTHPGLPVHV